MAAVKEPVLPIPVISKEELYLPGIQAFDSRSPDAAVDPTTLPIKVAFMAPATQPPEDTTDSLWKTAQWESQTTGRILIGPGTAAALTAGTYVVWLTVTGGVETPKRPVGRIRVTDR